MLYLSEENIDVGRLVSAWMKRQPVAVHANLEAWIKDYFFKVPAVLGTSLC